MKKNIGIALSLFLGGFVFIFGLWPFVEIIGSIFHSRPSNPWEYFSTRREVQEHLDGSHPGYSITEMEYLSYRGYIITVSDDKNSFEIDHSGALYCHHQQCLHPDSHKTVAGYDETLSHEYMENFEQALAEGQLNDSLILYLDHNLQESLSASSYREYGSQHANIVFSGVVEDLSPEYCAELLLNIRSAMDEAGLPFAVCTLELRNGEDSFYLFEFPYDEIYEDNLAERISAYKE